LAVKCGKALGKKHEAWVFALDAMINVGENKTGDEAQLRTELDKATAAFKVVQKVKADETRHQDFSSWNTKLETAFHNFMDTEPYGKIKSVIEDSVETSDFSNGTDDDEWTWESIRDLHTLTYGVSKVKLPNRPVKTAMIRNVINITMNTEISECALKMRRARVDQVPIVNSDKKLISMLYDRDLIGVLCRNGGQS
jgi:hypothetical protein